MYIIYSSTVLVLIHFDKKTETTIYLIIDCIFNEVGFMGNGYIIVSDVHLGSEKCNQKEFCCFLEWIQGLQDQGLQDPKSPPKIVKYKDKDIIIEIPKKIILLGDILELWNPKDGDRSNVVKDSMSQGFHETIFLTFRYRLRKNICDW